MFGYVVAVMTLVGVVNAGPMTSHRTGKGSGLPWGLVRRAKLGWTK